MFKSLVKGTAVAVPTGITEAKVVESVRPLSSDGHMSTFGVLNSLEQHMKFPNAPRLVTGLPAGFTVLGWPMKSDQPPLATLTFIGKLSLWSMAQVLKARPHCLRLLVQLMR